MSPLHWLPFAQVHADGSREFVDQLARTPISEIVVFVVILTVLRVGLTTWLNRQDPSRPIKAIGLVRPTSELLDAFIYAGVFVFMLIRPFAVQAFVIPSGSMWPQLYVNDFIVANKAVYRFSDPQRGDVVVFHPPSTGARTPDDLDASGEMKADFVKRCIGVPGDLIELKNGVLFRNGQPASDPHQAYSACLDDPEHCQNYRLLSPDEKRGLTIPSFKLVKFHGELIPLNYTNHDANAPIPEAMNFSDSKLPYSVATKFQIADPAEQKRAVNLPAERLPKGMYLMMGDNRNDSFDGRGWGLVSRDRIIGRAEFIWWPLSQIQRTR